MLNERFTGFDQLNYNEQFSLAVYFLQDTAAKEGPIRVRDTLRKSRVLPDDSDAVAHLTPDELAVQLEQGAKEFANNPKYHLGVSARQYLVTLISECDAQSEIRLATLHDFLIHVMLRLGTLLIQDVVRESRVLPVRSPMLVRDRRMVSAAEFRQLVAAEIVECVKEELARRAPVVSES